MDLRKEVKRFRTVQTSEAVSAFKEHRLHELLGPRLVLMEINNTCSLRCAMCERWKWVSQEHAPSGDMSTQDLKNLFTELADLGTARVTFIGIEPANRPDCLELVHALREKGIKPEVYTAGVTLSDRLAEGFVDNDCDVAISIDGLLPETHNNIRGASWAYDIAVASIHRLQAIRDAKGKTEEDVRLTANFTVQKANLADLSEDLLLIDNIGADAMRFGLAHGPGNFALQPEDVATVRSFLTEVDRQQPKLKTRISPSKLMRYLAAGEIVTEEFAEGRMVASLFRKNRIHCFRTEYSVMIDPEGNVYPCSYAYYDNESYQAFEEKRLDLRVGNIHEKSFTDIWNGEKYQRVRQELAVVDADKRPFICGRCEYFPRMLGYQQVIDKYSENPDAAPKEMFFGDA